MKKSTLLMVLSLVLALTVGLGTTLAYLTDTDADVNVMTLGNVDIEQHEYERVPDGNGGYEKIDTDRGESYELQEFTQGKPLYPAVGEVTGWDPTKVYNAQFGKNHMLGSMDVLDGLENVQDKFVYVENTGKSDAYIRTIIAYEMGSLSEERFDEIVALSTNSFWKNSNIGVTNIDGTNYFVCEYVYDGNMYPEGAPMIENENGRHPDGIVHPGDWTYNNLAQIYLKPEATNEDVEAIDGNKNGTYDILVVSQAVQAAGFEDAETALNEAFGKITADNNPWKKDGQDIDGTPLFPVFVETAEELIDALAEGGNIQIQADITLTDPVNVEKISEIDLNGYTFTASVFEAKADTTLKNGTFVHGESTYPQLSVSGATLKLENMDIICEEYCNIVTGNSGAQAAEYAGLEVWSGKAILDNCNLTVRSDVKRYSNSVFAIGIHGGEVTMNGGSITVDNAGSTRVNYEAPIFAGSDPDKAITLNNVTMNLGEEADLLLAWGGKTTINTTDAKDSWTDDRIDTMNGKGTYTINYK